jgi:hypothetical protein
LPTAQLDSASQPYLRELGRMVIAGSRLEELSRSIASLTAAVDDDTPIDEVLDALSKRLPRRKPPLERGLLDELEAWIVGARMLLDARSRVFAASASGHFTGAGSDAVHVVMPDESVVAADTEYLERMIQRMHRHDVSGHLLHLQLEQTAVGAGSGSDPIALRPEVLHPTEPVTESVSADDSATG